MAEKPTHWNPEVIILERKHLKKIDPGISLKTLFKDSSTGNCGSSFLCLAETVPFPLLFCWFSIFLTKSHNNLKFHYCPYSRSSFHIYSTIPHIGYENKFIFKIKLTNHRLYDNPNKKTINAFLWKLKVQILKKTEKPNPGSRL